MSDYRQVIAQRFMARTHNCFIAYGATRDLQLGLQTGSALLVDHILALQAGANDRLCCAFQLGRGWQFNADNDRAEFKALTGLDDQAGAGDFAGLTGSGSNDDDLPIDAPSAVGLIDAAMRQTKKEILIVVNRAELVCPNQTYDRMPNADKAILSILGTIASDKAIESSGNMLILITDNLSDLHESLRLASSRYYAIEITPPEYAERLQIAQLVFPQLLDDGVSLELTAPEFAQATSMLSRYGLMDVLLDANAAKALTKDQVKAVKAQVMSQEYGDVLETLEPLERGFDSIAGLEPLKAVFEEIFSNMIGGNFADVPAGILLAGAAGLGKTHFCRGLAGQSGLPVINFNVGRLLGSFVGQSERNLERALTAIKSAAPCIVVLDEIETTFPDRSSAAPNGDSGVSSRILKRMLEELSNPNNRGRVVWIGMTNFPNKLDAALSRAGRFDLTIAFLPPTENERRQLLALYAVKYGVSKPEPETVNQVSKALIGYTNAEIENIIRKARQLARTMDVDTAWIESVKRVRANTRDVQLMTNLALAAVNDCDLLPPEYIDQWRKITNQVETGSKPEPEKSKRLF